jgi:4-amino-4-deoxy-L-arabinose transferase-like glycosyltransferase
VVVAAWRTWRGADAAATRQGTLLALVWLGVWVGAFSAAATKLPNYVLPAYPAAALIVASIAVSLARRAAAAEAWPHPRWLATGVACLVFGGAATMATVILAAQYGMPGAEPAAIVGLVPLVGAAACWMLARQKPGAAVTALCVTGLVYSALMVGPAQLRIATANTIPDFVRDLRSSTADGPRIGTYQLPSPNVVFYAGGHTTQIRDGDLTGVAAFLASSPDAVLLLPERQLEAVRGSLPAGCEVVSRTRPVFRQEDVVAVGRPARVGPRTAATPEVTR